MAERQKPGPKAKPTSKRNDPEWIVSTLFLRAETKRMVKEVQAWQELNGVDKQDASDLIHEALMAYLPAKKDRLELQHQKK